MSLTRIGMPSLVSTTICPMSSMRTNAAFDPHQRAVFALLDAAGAVVAAVHLDRAAKQLMGNAACRKCIAERHDLEGPHVAAERVDVGNPRNRSERGTDDPIEQAAPLGERQLGTVDGEHEHFAERARDRREPAAHALGQVARDIGQAFGDLVARPVDVGAILEVNGDVRKRVFRGGAQDLLVRQSQ